MNPSDRLHALAAEHAAKKAAQATHDAPLATVAQQLTQFAANARKIQEARMDAFGPAIAAAPAGMCPEHPGVALRPDVERSAFESAKNRRVTIVHHECPECVDGEARRRLTRQLIKRGIPPRSIGVTLETWEPDWEPLFAEQRAKAWREVMNWTKAQQHPFLVILGARGGTGKTALGVAALRALGPDIRCLEFRDWIGNLLSMDVSDRQGALESQRRYRGLMIDDFGNRHTGAGDERGGNSFERDCLAALLNHRFENRLPTVITTNLDAVSFAGRLDDRTVDRIRSGRVVIDASGWPSRRAAEGI